MKITVATIQQLLSERHPLPEWAFVKELRGGTGYKMPGAEQAFDAWAINCYAGNQWQRVAYEIKVTRSDFSREIATPLKRRHALRLSNQFYFVAPQGVIPVDKIPIECGLLEATPFRYGDPAVEGLQLKRIVSAPWRDTDAPSWCFVASLVRRLLREFNRQKPEGGEG